MSEALSTLSLKRLVKFPFQDANWASRFLVGTLLTLANYIIPILPGIFVSGYVLRIMRQTVAGEEPALPAWDDWGEMTKIAPIPNAPSDLDKPATRIAVGCFPHRLLRAGAA